MSLLGGDHRLRAGSCGVSLGHGSVEVLAARPSARPTVRRRPAAPAMASSGPTPLLRGSRITPHASSRKQEGSNSPARSFSFMQRAIKIPILGSLLGGSHSQDNNGNGASGPGNGTAAAAAASSGHGDGSNGALPEDGSSHLNLHSAAAQPPLAGEANGHNGWSANGNGASHWAAGSGSEGVAILGTAPTATAATAAAEPAMHVENNILPYSQAGPAPASLALQIREIAATLRHINALRLEYVEKIEQQELALSAKDQALRNRDQRILALESELQEARKSLALLHSAQAATEAEVLRLRSAPSSAAAAPAASMASASVDTTFPATQSVPVDAAAGASAGAAHAPPGGGFVERHSGPPDYPEQRGLMAEEHARGAQLSATAASPSAVPPAAAATAPLSHAGPPHAAPPPQAAAPPPPPPPPPPPKAPEMVLSYRSSWPVVYLHCNVDGKGWTAPPGIRMVSSGAKEHTAHLQGRTAEFVLTNGAGEWDSPPGGPGHNYRIAQPGAYRLHYGTVTQVAAAQA